MSDDKHPDDATPAAYVIRYEDELDLGAEWRDAGVLRARRLLDTRSVRAFLPRDVEDVAVERVAPAANDSGEVEELEDGSISIPVFEEELVVTKRIVVRERIVVRKELVSERVTIDEDLRRERLAVDADDGVEVVDETDASPGGASRGESGASG